MSKHTPGPWIVWNDGHGNLSVRSANERDTSDATYLEIATEVGGLRKGQNFKDRSEEQANARLIAASPDLLEALQMVEDAYRDHLSETGEHSIPYSPLAKIRSAIAKATGEA